MTRIENINELNKILRTALITQGQLTPANVRNGLALHGEDLEKLIASTIYNSYEVTDCFALFELKFRESSNNLSFTDNETLTNPITNQSSFSFQVMIYGNGSPKAATQLMSRLRTEKVRQDLSTQGVWIERVTTPVSLNEYINDTLWLRTDIVIEFCCEMSFNQISTDYVISDLNSVNIQ